VKRLLNRLWRYALAFTPLIAWFALTAAAAESRGDTLPWLVEIAGFAVACIVSVALFRRSQLRDERWKRLPLSKRLVIVSPLFALALWTWLSFRLTGQANFFADLTALGLACVAMFWLRSRLQ
jgi:uncharacterized membrane protein YciS (DUF1049 family)